MRDLVEMLRRQPLIIQVIWAILIWEGTFRRVFFGANAKAFWEGLMK